MAEEKVTKPDPLTRTMLGLALPAMLDPRSKAARLRVEEGSDGAGEAEEGAAAARAEARPRDRRRATGPRTAEGKARVSRNALSHGLLSQATLMAGEDAEELEALRSGLRTRLQPEGELEELLLDQMVSSAWRLRRLHRIEAGLLELELRRVEVERADETLKKMGELYVQTPPATATREWSEFANHVEQHPMVAVSLKESMVAELSLRHPLPTLGLAFERCTAGADPLAKLGRYTTPIEKSFFRALHELQRLQAERRGVAVPPPAAGDLNVHLE